MSELNLPVDIHVEEGHLSFDRMCDRDTIRVMLYNQKHGMYVTCEVSEFLRRSCKSEYDKQINGSITYCKDNMRRTMDAHDRISKIVEGIYVGQDMTISLELIADKLESMEEKLKQLTFDRTLVEILEEE